MTFRQMFLIKILFFCISACAILTGCSQSSSVSSNRSVSTITPGEDIQIVDAYFSDYGLGINLVIKNTRDFKLPSFTMDFLLSCNNGYKIYSSQYFSLSSNEQDSQQFLVDSKATSCTFTINAIRPQPNGNYTDWTGSYPISIQKQNTETSDD